MASTCSQPDQIFTTPMEAVDALCDQLEPVQVETLPLAEAMGRITAEPIVTDRPSPPSDVSAMDGYAVCLGDVHKRKLSIADSVLPGRAAPGMVPGHAIRIMTGAVIPAGGEAVIMREQVAEHDDHVVISDDVDVKPGQNIRRRGENLQAGQQVLGAGMPIGPQVAAALASFGMPRVSVHQRLRVAIAVTGDELLPAEAEVQPWQIRDSNGPALETFCGGVPWTRVVRREHVTDIQQNLRDAFAAMLADCDVMFITGGVSAGTHDFVPAVLRELGCQVIFHRLPIRPGKPVLGGVGPDGQLIMGLPGNPVSVITTARRLAAAPLRKRAGFAQLQEPVPAVTLQNSDDKTLHLWWYRAVELTGDGHAQLVRSKGSGDVVASARSDGFVEIPPEQAGPGPWPFYRWTLS